MLKVYLAGRFSRFGEINGYKDDLAKIGVETTSRWLNGGHEWVGTADEDIPVEANAVFANEDLEDIDAADVLICFTEPPRSGPARGGRHVEFGYALAKQKPILVVGHRENVFYCLPEPHLFFCDTWSQALEVLQVSHLEADRIVSELSEVLQALGFPAFAKE